MVAHAENYAVMQGAPIVLDLTKLRLNEKLLEENGLDLRAPGRTMPYVDLTTGAPGRFDHTKVVNVHVPITVAEPIPPSGDPVVDRWINALQSGDRSAARALEREFAHSPEGQRMWSGAMAEARAEEMRQKPWLAHARDTPLFNQAMGHLDRLGPQMGQYWSREEKEQLAGVVAFEAKRGRLPEIHDIVPTRDGGLMAVWEHSRERFLDQRTGVIDPAQAAGHPLQYSMQQYQQESQRQEQQVIEAQQHQMQQHGRGMSM